MLRCDFYYSVKMLPDGRDVLCMVDRATPGSMSLTNGLEGALKDIRTELYSGLPDLIIYRDTQEIWDRVIWDGKTLDFRPLNARTLEDAINIIAADPSLA